MGKHKLRWTRKDEGEVVTDEVDCADVPATYEKRRDRYMLSMHTLCATCKKQRGRRIS